jgi:serine/threonine protein kinase
MNYEIQEILSSGGQGKVHLVYSKEKAKHFALKKEHKKYANLFREAKIYRKL